MLAPARAGARHGSAMPDRSRPFCRRAGVCAFAHRRNEVEPSRAAVATPRRHPRAQSSPGAGAAELHGMTSDLRIAEPDPGDASGGGCAPAPRRTPDGGRQPTPRLACGPPTFPRRQPPHIRHTDSPLCGHPNLPRRRGPTPARPCRTLTRQLPDLPGALTADLRDPLRGSRSVGASARCGAPKPLTDSGSARITATRRHRHRPASALPQLTPREAR
jgi:hypothetical protein